MIQKMFFVLFCFVFLLFSNGFPVSFIQNTSIPIICTIPNVVLVSMGNIGGYIETIIRLYKGINEKRHYAV